MIPLADELPWLLPGTLLSLLAAIAGARRVGAWLGVPALVAGVLVLDVGVILAATLSPLGCACPEVGTAAGRCDVSRFGLAPLAALWPPGDVAGNILGFVPIGFAIGLARHRRRATALLLVAILMPVAIEATQLLVESLGRSCEAADVVDNLTGVALGVAAGLVVAAGRAEVPADRGPAAPRAPRAG